MADQRHLEQLVFEILGDAEAKRRLKEVADTHSKAASEHEKASQRQADAAKKAAEGTKKTAKIAGAALLALSKLALEASADLEQAQGKVERSARKQRITTTELSKALEQADARSRRLGIGLVETREHMSALIDVTGEAAKASELYALAQDIAATGDVDLAQATDLLTRAFKGEVEELKKLDGVSKQQAELLAGISDESERARVAVEMLSKEYRGAADELKGTNDAIRNLKEAATDLLAVFGDTGTGLINATAQWFGVVDENEGLLDRFALGMRNFARDARKASSHMEAYLRWSQNGGAFGDRSFFDFVSEIDTERAQAEAERNAGVFTGETGTGYRIRRTGGRGGYGRGRGGHRDVPRERTRRTRGRGTAPTLDGFTGAFDENAPGQTLEEAAGEEAQREQERLDRIQTFQNNREQMEREHQMRLAEIQEKWADKRALDEAAAAEQALEAREKQQQAALDAARAGVEAGAQLAQSFIKDEGAKAVISGGLEIARSIAAAAGGNIPGSIAHGAAAAQFFAVAAQAGVGGGKKDGLRKGNRPGRERGGSSLRDDRERLNRVSDSRPTRRQSETVVININSALQPHPEQTRKLVDEMQREMRNRTRRS